MAIQQKSAIANISLSGNGTGSVFKLDLSLPPNNFETKGNRASAIEASVQSTDTTLTVTPTIAGERVTLTFNHAFSIDVMVNLVLYFDSQ